MNPQGVRTEFTTAYTPEENGVAERFNRTIVEMARSMLIWADGMQLLLDAKMLWPVVSDLEGFPDRVSRPTDYKDWKFDDAQAKAWIYMNLENQQHNHLKKCDTFHAMWETLRKMHDALKQSRLNFLKRKVFNYKAGPSESIDDVSSNLVRLQMTIRNIKSSEAPTDLDVAFTLINSVDDEAYTLARYPLRRWRT